jgi:hypothetical protein
MRGRVTGGGFHACEETHRWTDGDARVPAKFLACFDQDMTIEVHVQNHDLTYRTGQWGAERFAEKAAQAADEPARRSVKLVAPSCAQLPDARTPFTTTTAESASLLLLSRPQ